jgi:hypothetical protein
LGGGTALIAFFLTHWKWVLIAGLLVALGLQQARVSVSKTETAQAQRDYADYRAVQAENGRLAERAMRGVEQRWQNQFAKVGADGQAKLEEARADGAVAADDLERVRRQLAALRAAFGGRAQGAPVAPVGASAQGAPGMCPDLLVQLAQRVERLGGRARVYAGFADEAHAAGSTCEQASDALREP